MQTPSPPSDIYNSPSSRCVRSELNTFVPLSVSLFLKVRKKVHRVFMGDLLHSGYRRELSLPPGLLNDLWKCPQRIGKPCREGKEGNMDGGKKNG